MNIFLGLIEISGYYSSLQKGLSEIGHRADLYTFHPHKFKYKSQKNWNWRYLVLRIFWSNHNWLRRYHIGNMIYQKYFPRLYNKYYHQFRDIFFEYCLAKYDVFIYCYATSIYPDFEDYKRIKAVGKKLICFFHGSDSRPTWMDGAVMSASSGRTIEDCYKLNSETLKKVSQIEKYADYIISSPSSGQFLTKPFINSFNIGIPFNMNPVKRLQLPASGSIKILHSPSHPEGKGTLEIKKVIKKLVAEGFDIEFNVVQGQPNKVVLKEIKQSHLIIDQIYSDTPVANFALEGIANGTPVLVCGYFSKWYLDNTSQRNLPPALFVHPDDFEKTLREMIQNPIKYYSLLDNTRAFLEKEWTIKAVTNKFQRIFNNQPLKEWIISPKDVEYIEGWGMTKSKLKEMISSMHREYGIEAFMVNDKLTKKIQKLLSTAR